MAAVDLNGKGWVGCGGGGTKSHLGEPRVPPLGAGGAAKKMNSSCVKQAAAPNSRQPFHAARQLPRLARSNPAAAPAEEAGLGSPEHSTAEPSTARPVPTRPVAPHTPNARPRLREHGLIAPLLPPPAVSSLKHHVVPWRARKYPCFLGGWGDAGGYPPSLSSLIRKQLIKITLGEKTLFRIKQTIFFFF